MKADEIFAAPFTLTLGGGGARGLAHIGVLRARSRKHLVDYLRRGLYFSRVARRAGAIDNSILVHFLSRLLKDFVEIVTGLTRLPDSTSLNRDDILRETRAMVRCANQIRGFLSFCRFHDTRKSFLI